MKNSFIEEVMNNGLKVEEKSGVYVIINENNYKFYIGSSNDINHRFSCHFSELRNNDHGNEHLQNAFNIEPEAFEKFVYCYCENYKEVEQQLLDIYWDKSDMCYNISNTVEGNSISEKGRKILSDKMKKMHQERPEVFEKFYQTRNSEEHRANMSVMAKKQREDPEYTKNLTEYVSKAKQRFWDVTLIDPNGEKHYIGWNLRKFCEKFKFDKSNIITLIRQEAKSRYGWTLDLSNSLHQDLTGIDENKIIKMGEKIEKPLIVKEKKERIMPDDWLEKTTKASQLANSKFYNVTLIHENGTEEFISNNLSEFIRKYNLKDNIYNVVNGEAKTRYGWRLKTTEIPEIKVKSPDGEIYVVGYNVSEFCRMHNIKGSSHFTKLLKGKIKICKGWTLA